MARSIMPMPEWSQGKSAALEAASSSTRGSGWGSFPGSAEVLRAARRALGRRRERAGALPRGHFDRAAMPKPMFITVPPAAHSRTACASMSGASHCIITASSSVSSRLSPSYLTLRERYSALDASAPAARRSEAPSTSSERTPCSTSRSTTRWWPASSA
eukprot:scaffold36376_cov59-Phaeocystis_antarctica.AAC.1